ncbi:MAG: hypothetical protein H0W84_07165 [Bacteroidetes bacterium]|nr:hypothetical protein [Bacteroidota bacterium]
MIRLLKIEFHKVVYYKTFWIIFGLYVILLAPIAYGCDHIVKSLLSQGKGEEMDMVRMMLQDYSIFNFPDVWLNMAYVASCFKLFLAVVIVLLVTNEYSYRTLRQNIIDGMSKWEVIWAKELIILILSISAVILLVSLTLILGDSQSDVSLFQGSSIIFPYFISLIMYLNFAYFLSTWLKKSGFVIGILFLYSIVIETLISYKLPENIRKFLPMNLINNMIPNPLGKFMGENVVSDSSILNIAVCTLYTVAFIFLNNWMLKKGQLGK